MKAKLTGAMTTRQLKHIILTIFMTGACGVVWSQIQPVAVIDFDDGFNAQGRDGIISGIPLGTPVLAAGRQGGKALKAGPLTGHVNYPTTNVLNRTAGTVEMWVCPLDWVGNDGKFHVFFQAKGEGALYLYKFHSVPNLLMLTCDDVTGPYASTSFWIEDWKPGKWHHIAGTWSSSGVMVYLDGKPTASGVPAPGKLPKQLGETFTIGDLPWQEELSGADQRQSGSLIDEVRIYDRALSAAHIAAHAKGDYSTTPPLAQELTVMTTSINKEAGTVSVTIDTAGADVKDKNLSAAIAVCKKGAPFPKIKAQRINFKSGIATGKLPLPSISGAYTTMVRLYENGNATFDLEEELVIPSTEWLGNKIGLGNYVIAPWTPLVADQDSVSCWGRTYLFAGQPLPVQIKSASSDLLARPIRIHMSYGSENAPLEDTQIKLDSISDTRAELSGTATATYAGGQDTLKFSHWLEYDGLLMLNIRRAAPTAPAPQTISLEIALRPEHATYFHRFTKKWLPVTGNLPKGNGVVASTPFVPFAWLGDNDRGLFWFCESDEMWPNALNGNAIEVVREDGAVVIRLNLLTAGQKLPADWHFSFGLQATPVKPIPSDWRKWRMTPGKNANLHIAWPEPNSKDSFRWFGWPEARDPDRFNAYIASKHVKNQKTMPYLVLTFMAADIPEWKYFQSEWEMGQVDSCTVARWGYPFPMVSPASKGYSDFLIWKTKEFMEKYHIDGAYHDQTHPYWSSNTKAGVGYIRDGKEHDVFPILAYRELYRRNYIMMKELPWETFSMTQMTGKMMLPVLAYDDCYLDGEHYRSTVKDNYMDVASLDVFRAEYMGKQWGLVPFFLPEFHGEYKDQVVPTRGLMTLLMLHDINVWPQWCNVDVVDKALDALHKFGYVYSDFLPYFANTPPATTDMQDVYISAYRRKDGKALLIVGNIGREDRSGRISIDPEGLGLALDTVMSWPKKKSLKVTDSSVTIDVPGLGYRMILICN